MPNKSINVKYFVGMQSRRIIIYYESLIITQSFQIYSIIHRLILNNNAQLIRIG